MNPLIEVDATLNRALTAIDQVTCLKNLDKIRTDYLGKKGAISVFFHSLQSLAGEEKKTLAQLLNQSRDQLSQKISEKKESLIEIELAETIQREKLDITLPGQPFRYGTLHPLTIIMRRIEKIFTSAGFSVATGPEIEDEYHNFSALNIAENHPARAMHDTFYFDGGLLLRTHTSPVQIRALSGLNPPLRLIAPGRVYRCDSDDTHTPMFHQVEGLLIDKTASMKDLFEILASFLKLFFEDQSLKLRFRPSFFPFTEPSAEVDISTHTLGTDGWLEVLGCGMVHPKVIENMGLNASEWSGYAFGLGIERLAMLYYRVPNIRLFFENDVRFLKNF